MIQEIAGVILAGGQNTRFPALKAFIKVEDLLIIEKNLRLLTEIFNEALISTNMPEKYFYLGAPMIGDALPSRGPMSGIYSSLINAKGDCIFVIACDMPFVKREVVSLICKKHLEMSSIKLVDATIPVFNDEPQPLFGVYCKTALPYLENCVLNEKTSMKRLLSEINTNFIGESDIITIDPDGRSFVNINTMEDYKKAVNSEQ